MSNSQFQLFPPPAPQGVSKNPFRKGPRRPSAGTQAASSIPLEDLKVQGAEAKAVVLQVVEPQSTEPPPQAHVPPLPPRSFMPELCPGPSTGSSSSRGDSPSLAANPSSGLIEDDGTNLRITQDSSQRSVSPVIPMKSIFPRFNPDAPLTQQQYRHGVSNSFSRPRPRPPKLSLDITPAPEIDRVLGPRTVPADIVDFPAGIQDPVEVQYSTPAQLKNLWEAANGQRHDNIEKNFNLRMERLDSATFVFGETNTPFYTMQTYSTNEVSITRGNPSLADSNIPIMMLQLEDRRRREPPNDGLVSHLFSRLAAMLAIDQAAELSAQHQLSPPDASDVEKKALKRAAALESCKLSWNSTKRIYELRHPSLRVQQNREAPPPALVGAAGIALSPTRPKHTSGALDISVSTPSAGRGQPQAPTILVTAPLPSNPVDAAAIASPRISTLPLSGSDSESDETLASLDLRTMTLSIAAFAICNTIPSLYAIDSIVAAILAVAVSDLTTNPVLADMPIYDPTRPPTRPPTKQPIPPQPAYMSTQTNRPELFATLAERDDLDRQSIQLPAQLQTQIPKRHRNWWSSLRSKIIQLQQNRRQKSKAKSTASASPATVVEEIDLEKYGINSSPSTKEQVKEDELPGLARGLIKLFFWGLKLVFWALTVAFKIAGWGLKLALRCVTGEKA
ncbi:hypothetical protein BJX61DRAFT_543254 [Aspergillus egyptiacus]|nr:hypothetical protein BJX61DRAFT_543254 [Aspergillus egyptiacus]